MSDVADRVRRIVADHFSIAIEKAHDGASFIGDLDADSLDVIEITMAIEETFGVVIDDEVMEGMATVGDAVRATALIVGRAVAP